MKSRSPVIRAPFSIASASVAALVLLLAAGCEPDAALSADDDVIVGRAVCDPQEPAATFRVQRRLAAVGPSANALAIAGRHLHVLESGSNTISRLALPDPPGANADAAPTLERAFVDLGNERNPYGMFLDDTSDAAGPTGYVANFSTDSLSVVDLRAGEVATELFGESFRTPSGVTATARHVYVTNVHYLSRSEGYGPGSVTVIDRATLQVLGQVPTEFDNPQYITVLETPDGPAVAISSTGALRQTNDGVTAASEGGLELWFETADPLAPARESYPLGQLARPTHGAPGVALPAPDGRHLYFTSALAPVLFKFDLDARRWVHDAADPLELYAAEGDLTHHGAIGPDGLLYVTSFNQDALYVLDTRCDALVAGPIDIGTSAALLEGPHALAIDARDGRTDVYFLMSIANAIGRVSVDWGL